MRDFKDLKIEKMQMSLFSWKKRFNASAFNVYAQVRRKKINL